MVASPDLNMPLEFLQHLSLQKSRERSCGHTHTTIDYCLYNAETTQDETKPSKVDQVRRPEEVALQHFGFLLSA